MSDLSENLQGAKRLIVTSRLRLIYAAWALVMRCFREPA